MGQNRPFSFKNPFFGIRPRFSVPGWKIENSAKNSIFRIFGPHTPKSPVLGQNRPFSLKNSFFDLGTRFSIPGSKTGFPAKKSIFRIFDPPDPTPDHPDPPNPGPTAIIHTRNGYSARTSPGRRTETSRNGRISPDFR